jgi:hypothetical protein
MIEKEDHIIFRWTPPFWWLPVVFVLKSGQRERWTAIFSWTTDETQDCYFMYWLQFRAWWPPIFFHRGWIKKGKHDEYKGGGDPQSVEVPDSHFLPRGLPPL